MSSVKQNQFDQVMKLVANKIQPVPTDMTRYPTEDVIFNSNKKEKTLSAEKFIQAIREAIQEYLMLLGREIQINVTKVPKPYIARSDWNKLVEVVHSVGYPDEVVTASAEEKELKAANKRAREFFENMTINFKGIKKTVKELIDEQQDKNKARELRETIEMILVGTLIEIKDNFPQSEENADDDVSLCQDFIKLLKDLDKHIELEREATNNFLTKESKPGDATTVDMSAVTGDDSSVDEAEATFISKIRHGQSKEPLKISYELKKEDSKTVYRLRADLNSLSTSNNANSLIFAPELITKAKIKPSEMVVFEMFIILMKKLQETGKPFEGKVHVNEPHVLIASIAKIAYSEYMQALYGDDAPKVPEIHGATKFNASQLSESERAIKDRMLMVLKHSSEIKAQENDAENLKQYKP